MLNGLWGVCRMNAPRLLYALVGVNKGSCREGVWAVAIVRYPLFRAKQSPLSSRAARTAGIRGDDG